MFAQTIERRLQQARAKKSRVLRPMTRARHIFALMATYGLRHIRARHRVARRILRYRRHWWHMLEQLCAHQLWSPVSDIQFIRQDVQEEARFDFAFGLCARCLPTCVKWSRQRSRRYSRKIKADIIPCRKTNICPACFAAVSEQQYRQFRRVLNALQQQQAVRVTVRCETVFVPAAVGYDPDFQPQEMLAANIRILRAAIAARRVPNGSALHKRLQRHTLGAFWRLLAIPRDGGWDVVTRWAFLTATDCSPPTTLFGDATVKEQVVLVPQRCTQSLPHMTNALDEEIAYALLEFARYPKELLTSSVDLVAAWLHAAAKTRVVSGFGLLTQAGSSLLPEFKRRDKSTRAERKARCAKEKNCSE